MKDFMINGSATITAAEASGGKEIRVGFVPKKVTIYNKTQGQKIEWIDSMDDGGYMLIDDTASTGGVAYATSGGITKVDGDQEAPQGFSIAAARLTENDVIFYSAQR